MNTRKLRHNEASRKPETQRRSSSDTKSDECDASNLIPESREKHDCFEAAPDEHNRFNPKPENRISDASYDTADSGETTAEAKLMSSLLDEPILPALMKFSIPVLLTLMLQALYGAVDLWAVGTFAAEADVSAVSTGSQTMQIITGVVTGLSMGTTVLLGQRIGEGNREGAAAVTGTSILVFAALGVILSILMVPAAPRIAVLMNAPDEALAQTTQYIRICGAGSIFISGYNLISALFRGLGNSRAPLVFVSIACVVNIFGDIILIYGFKLGTTGAAIATIGAQAVSVVMSILLIRRKGLPFTFKKKHLYPQRAAAAGVLKIGSPVAFQEMCNEISYLIIIGFVNTLGVTASAGVGIAEKLVIFILLIPMAYMQSISAFTAQNTGAGKYKRARRAVWVGMGTAALLGFIVAGISFVFGDALSRLFIDNRDVIAASAEFLKATSMECFILSIAYCFTGYFNGLGRTTFVMLQGICAIFLVKIPYSWYASVQPSPSLFQIGLSTVFAALFTLVICLGYYCFTRRRIAEPQDLSETQN